MKSFYLCILSLFFLFSCSESSDLGEMKVSKVTPSLSYRVTDTLNSILPVNHENPYDYVGQLHYELYQDYYAQHDSVLTVDSVIYSVELRANQNLNFIQHFGSDYSFTNVTALQQLLSCKTLCLDTVLAQSSLSSIAKEKTQYFLVDFNVLFEKNLDSSAVLDYIVQFENEIITSSTLSVFDKSIILSTTSIARYSAYESKRRPKKNTDPDWDSLITSLYGVVLGAENGVENGIVASLVCGIITNQ